jgi:glycosyltransferase involved in cell wall biosynthesis
MIDNKATTVGFLFFSVGQDWQGGRNYYRSLFEALVTDPDCQLKVIAFIGYKTDPSDFSFPSFVNFVKSRSLDRFSFSWFFDRIFKKLFGICPLLECDLKKAGVQVISHCDLVCLSNLKTISWITDFQHIYLPHFFSPQEVSDRNKQFLSTLSKSHLIIVSSNSALQDLKKFSQSNGVKARVLQFCALSPDLSVVDDVVNLYDLNCNFFYIPNQLWAHKNHRLALEALALVCKERPDAQIVCSGSLSDYRNPQHIKELMSRVTELNLRQNFRFLGLIPYRHIACLMAKSSAVINPSLFEGWSTTVEESKSLGVPLLLSDIPVHREQCSNGEALFFGPDDVTKLATLMIDLLNTDEVEWTTDVRIKAGLLHKKRMIEFSRGYHDIVNELTDRSDVV